MPLPAALNLILEQAVQSVHDLHVQINLTYYDGNRLGELLVGNTNLQRLSLVIGSTMTEDGAHRLARGFQESQLKRLELSCDIDDDNFFNRNITKILYLAGMASVSDFVLWDDIDDDDAALVGQALMRNENLKSLHICLGDDVTDNAASELAIGISNSLLSKLHIEGFNYAEVDEIIFAHGVRNCLSIRHLTIGDGTFSGSFLHQCVTGWTQHLAVLELGELEDAELVFNLSAALPLLASLTSLSVAFELAFQGQSDNVVVSAGADMLITAVSNHPCLVYLNLTNSFDVRFAGLEMIGRHLPNIVLKELVIAAIHETCFSLVRTILVVNRAHRRACQELITGVQANMHLRVLNVEDLRLPKRVVKKIDFYVGANKAGRYLLQEESVPLGLWCLVLGNKCRNNAGFMYCFLREQPHLLLAAPIFCQKGQPDFVSKARA